jgi:predicted HTH transcriptional regulator
MNLLELRDLVSKGEGQHLEFKLKATFPEKIVREMVGFANSGGGQLLVGVDDDGRIAGLKFAEEERFVIDRAIRVHGIPGLKYQSQFIPLNSKRSILHYRVSESRRKPVYFLENPVQNTRGEAFIRHQDKTIKASPEMVQILKRSRGKKSTVIKLGNEEQQLFNFIARHGKATLMDFMHICGLSRALASKKLVDLVMSNILEIVADEKVDYFIMKNQEPRYQ